MAARWRCWCVVLWFGVFCGWVESTCLSDAMERLNGSVPMSSLPAWEELYADGRVEWFNVEGTRCSKDTPFFFGIRRGDPRKVHVFFTGGRLCVDERCCQTTAKDTGDLWLGSNPDVNYATCTRTQVGSNNGRAVVSWVLENMAEMVESVVVTGGSAGSYGSLYHGAWLFQALQKKAKRRIEFSWFGDSGVGGLAVPPQWNLQDGAIGALLSSRGGFLNVTLPEEGSSLYWFLDTHRLMLETISGAFPCLRMGEFNFDADVNQIGAFQFTAVSLLPQFTKDVKSFSSVWSTKVREEMKASAESGVVSHYSGMLAVGSYHTIELNDTFFTVKGTTYTKGSMNSTNTEETLAAWFQKEVLTFSGDCVAEPGAPMSSSTPFPYDLNQTGSSRSLCFPGDAMVRLDDGSSKPMRLVQVGDRVQTASGTFSDVYFFSHRSDGHIFPFVQVDTKQSSIVLSHTHYVISERGLVAAEQLHLQDKILSSDGSFMPILKLTNVHRRGLYNPHTLDGSIMVDNLAASCFTSAINWYAAQLLLAPIRACYRLGIVVPGFLDGAHSNSLVRLLKIS